MDYGIEKKDCISIINNVNFIDNFNVFDPFKILKNKNDTKRSNLENNQNHTNP